MESLWRHILKSVFDEFVTGLDENIDCSKSMVELWDLQLKREKIHEMYGDCLTSPVEFNNGKIGSMQMKMSWLGNIEISANNVVLNLNFTPFKAMKNAIMPGAEVQEGFVHRVPEDLRRAEHWRGMFNSFGSGPPPAPPAYPRYCKSHMRRGQRKRGEARDAQCQRCKVRLLTNYVECSLCIPCSLRESQCVLCAAAVPKTLRAAHDAGKPEGFVYTVAEMRHPDYMASIQTGAPLPYQVPPRFCKFHERPDRQRTGEVRNGQCMICKARLQTNFDDAALCAPCSSKENKCLLCGAYQPMVGTPQQGGAGSALMMERLEFATVEELKSRLELLSPERGASGRESPGPAWRNAAAGLDGQAAQNTQLKSDPLPARRMHSDPDPQSHDRQDRERQDSRQHVEKTQEKDALTTPEGTPRRASAFSPDRQRDRRVSESKASPRRGSLDDLDVPLEDTKPRLDIKKNPAQQGGASTLKNPIAHSRSKWQHHSLHSDSTDFHPALCPPPPDFESQASHDGHKDDDKKKSGEKKGLVHSAASGAAHAAGKLGGFFGFGHHGSKEKLQKHDETHHEEVNTPPSDGHHGSQERRTSEHSAHGHHDAPGKWPSEHSGHDNHEANGKWPSEHSGHGHHDAPARQFSRTHSRSSDPVFRQPDAEFRNAG